MMVRTILLATALALATPALTAPALAQEQPGLGEVLVGASRYDAPFWPKDRPVVGLRQPADGLAMNLTITSDSRDAETRKREIHTALLAAMDRAAAAGLQLVSGKARLEPVTRLNYKDLPQVYAGRVDTSKVELLVRGKLDGSSAALAERLKAFIATLKGNGRATVESDNSTALSITNPDQYRDRIIAMIAADARHTAALFGPEFTFNLVGVDGQVAWSQASPTEVFLFIPYRYTIVPR